MNTTSSIGARLDRLPLSGFHHRLPGLIAAGMFFDSFDIYIAGSVLAVLINNHESLLLQAVIVATIGPETKNRSLEDIADVPLPVERAPQNVNI